jgi:carbonic anhydrase/acetyltransferase-like protein (isoleucine patch superfamily)
VTTFDFGSGLEPAYRHRNPDGSVGGWVAATATVNPDVYVGPHARIYGRAVITGSYVSWNAHVFGNAWVVNRGNVSGDARVGGDALILGSVSGTARVSGNARIFGKITQGDVRSSPFFAKIGSVDISQDGNIIHVGWQSHTIDEWSSNELQQKLVRVENLSEKDIAIFRGILSILKG